jgi:hypothetical protein
MVLKADWLLSALMNRQAALWDCRPDGFDLYWDEPSWTDLSADPSHRLLHVIKPMLHYGL